MALEYLICSISELANNYGPNQKKGRYALDLRTCFLYEKVDFSNVKQRQIVLQF